MMQPSDVAERVREIENVWIPMPDGCRIAARVWLPKSAEREPVPAILEYIPYRKRDFTRSRDEPIHRYFAASGYAAVRVDVRGSGDSGGILSDEYTRQELEDALATIAWIAEQPWCSGKVGMMGISWGGFNSLQVAALGPPALAAVITLCSTDDRYADDAHYMGGCLLNENMQWGSILMANCALPPDPEIVGDGWRETWIRRLEALEPFPALWMEHQTRDDYWRHGSVCEDYGAIDCAVYAVGGWADGYSNAVPRLLAGLRCPRKGLIGPWAHVFPHHGVPGPAIGFLQEAVRWWDHWLRGRDNGIMDEPMLRVWMQDSVPPRPDYETRPGRWVAEDAWPSPRIAPLQLHVTAGGLSDEPGPDTALSICSPQTTGLAAGEWCAFGADREMPLDQRLDDGRSLTFDGPPLVVRTEILGAPEVELGAAADRPVAMLAARLEDVAPDGAATLVTYGLLNLTHREGHDRVAPLEPGRFYRVGLRLNDIAHAFPAGHRLRLALSSAYWPIAWPTPEPVTLTVKAGRAALRLPVRPPRPADEALPDFEPPRAAPGARPEPIHKLPRRREIVVDLTTLETLHRLHGDAGELGGASLARLAPIGMELGYTLERRHRIGESDPLSAATEVEQKIVQRRPGWAVRVECRTSLRATREAFVFEAELEAYEGAGEGGAESLVRRRDWRLAIPRNGV